MATLEELREVRLKKLALLRQKGMDPYPAVVARDFSLAALVEEFPRIAPERALSIAGRIMALRPQGALTFIVLNDGTGKFQALIKKDEISADQWELFEAAVDIGDFLEVTGTLFTTARGEKTLAVKRWKMVSKSLLPLPEKWHGLQDEEEKLRKRYLDILFNPAIRELLEKKAKFWQFIRGYMIKAGFLEVETPTLELTTGGAEARPFKTHHNDYDIDVFLRISVGELWQKRLLAAGFPRVFEIGRIYRNEGSSPEHLQEFTNIEFYAAYMDYEEGMVFTEKLLREMAEQVFGTTKFSSRGFEFDFANGGKPWPKLDYVEAIEKMAGVNILKATEEEMRAKLDELKVKYDGTNKERLIDTLWKYCRKQIAGPTWLVNHPKIVSPLAKANLKNLELTQRVQLILAGAEVTNGFSELNDPVDQRARFQEQQKLIDRGDEEAMMPDIEFVEMLEHAMPPAFGNGFGERLFAILAGVPVRDAQTFPLVRPKKEKTEKNKE